MSEKKKLGNKKFMILGVLVFIFVLGVSYAWLVFVAKGEKEINLVTGKVSVEIIEQEEDLDLDSSVPMTDDEGRRTTAFTFSIRNNSLTNVEYTLKLIDNQKKIDECSGCETIPYDNIRYEITRPGLDKIDTLTEEREIDTGILKPGEENKMDYTLKLWLKEEAGNDVIGKNFYGKLEISGIQTEKTEANKPELGDKLIPVVYDEKASQWRKADMNSDWYNYEDQRWANAVIVTPDSYANKYQKADAGVVVSMTDILQMYVWIPRYSYTIKGQYGKGGIDANNPGEIEVEFVENTIKDTGSGTYEDDEPSGWYTPDAFTLGNKELSGIWVGKFESGYKDAVDATGAQKDESEPQSVIIKPGVYSWRGISVSNIYNTAKGIAGDSAFEMSESIYDSHAMKNDEWGAVAYLTQSKYGKYGNEDYKGANKEVYINNYYVSDSDKFKTGCSGGAPGLSQSANCISYNNLESAGEGMGQKGPGASTTGNIYGVYDMAGGSWEYVMGNYSHTPGQSEFSEGWNTQYKDYINFYTTSAVSTACSGLACKSHALSETVGWYGDYSYMVTSSVPWFHRSGGYLDATRAGVFYFSYDYGDADFFRSFRVVLTLK